MDANPPPPNHGGPIGDVWFRGLPKPDHLLAVVREDFYILVVGCMMKYIRLEKDDSGLNFKSRIVKTFAHGVDGVSAICGCPTRDVYAMAEKRMKPRIFIFQIHKTDRGELEPQYQNSLKRVNSWDIRTMQFISKELFVVLTGIPTFNVVLFKWTTNEEIMTSISTEPNLFSKLLISPTNPCHWMEYGDTHMYFYELPSASRPEVTRTQVNLPTRRVQYEHADPMMGRPFAIKIVSACWTNTDQFFILDEQYCVHKYIPNLKILQWTCSLRQTFLGCYVTQIVQYADGLAAITADGWFLNYGPIAAGGSLEVLAAFKLSSNVLRYIQFPDSSETFYAITESKGAIEGVTNGLLRDAFTIPDLLFSNVIGCCFIEPQADYMATVTKFGKVVVLECNTGEPVAKWKLPFKVVGISCHPVLPFLFCGTAYGCVNILDVRNLKTPKLINRRFVTREANPSIEKFGFVSQGRYVVSADVNNNRIFVQYGYPFMSFDFVDTAKLPARISQISVPGCGKDDNRFQVFMSGKSKSDEGVVAFIINFSLRNDRIMVLASQTVDQPVTTICMTPMRKYLYAFYPLKKGLGVVSFCDDNQWLNLQDPEHYVESRFSHDVASMVFNGDKIYTFCEDGFIQVHEAPIIPKKKAQLPMVLNTLAIAQTHCYSEGGIKEGIVSLDGSQVIAIGHDGTFARVRFFPKPKEADWQTLGYERPKLIDYQVGTYLIDQEFHKSGEEFIDRIADIKIHIDQLDPVNFYLPGEESDEDEDAPPNSDLPKAETNGEKFKYGPRKSFKGTITRKKIQRSAKGDTGVEFIEVEGSKSESSSSQSKRHVTIGETLPTTAETLHSESAATAPPDEGHTSGGETTRADDISAKDAPTSDDKSEKSAVVSDSRKSDTQAETGSVVTETSGKRASQGGGSVASTVSPPKDEETKKDDSLQSSDKSSDPSTKNVSEDPNATGTAKQDSTDSPESQKSKTKKQGEEHTEGGLEKQEIKDDVTIADVSESMTSMKSPPDPANADVKIPEIVVGPIQVMKDPAGMQVEKVAPEPTAAASSDPDQAAGEALEPSADASDNAQQPKAIKPGASSAVLKLMNKVHDVATRPQEEPTPPKPSQTPPIETTSKTATVTALKSTAPTSTALKGVLSERIRRKQMAKEKSKHDKDHKHEDKKPEETEVVEAPVEEVQFIVVEEKAEETAAEGATTDEEERKSLKKGFKGFGEMKKAAKVLSLMFGKKKDKKKDDKKSPLGVRKSKKKIKKFQGGQASKMLAAQASSSTKVKAPPSRTARNRMGQAKLVKQLLDDDKSDSLAKLKKKKRPMRRNVRLPQVQEESQLKKGRKRKEDEQSDASKALMMEVDLAKNLEVSVLEDPAIYLLPEKEKPIYEGLDVGDVLTVHHAVRRREYTEPEFFAQFEKTLLYRQHFPKAQGLRREYMNFSELMDDLMMFNKQREVGNQVEMKEFNFDEDREPRLHERAQKLKKIAHIQMVIRNKLRHATIKVMKHLVWDQFETKGMTVMGFRKKLEVSNYPLIAEKQFYHGAVREAISWRRLEQKLKLQETHALLEADTHALRVLHHEMQYVPPLRKRLYMKSIMAIDPQARFEDFEASDSEQSDDEFFAKVFEELGIQPEELGPGRGTIFLKSGVSLLPADNNASYMKMDGKQQPGKGGKSVTHIASKGTGSNKAMKKKNNEDSKRAPQDVKKLLQQQDSKGEALVEKLKRYLLEEEAEDEVYPHRPIISDQSSMISTEATTRVQSKRDFMINIKATKGYLHPKGIFGPKGAEGYAVGGAQKGAMEVEMLMEPHVQQDVRVSLGGELKPLSQGDYVSPENKPRMRMVTKQKKKMRLKRIDDVVFDAEDDFSLPEDEIVIQAQKEQFDKMDEEYKERFDTISNIFYGSCLYELKEMYHYKPANYRYSQFDLASRHELWRHHYIIMSEIYQMKKFFNRQFEMLRNAKGYSLRKMSDRNERIREIYYYLKVDLDILNEKWRLQEDPSQIFTVTKEEVPVEKYLTTEQRRLEEIRRLEDLARRRTRMAEFRKKALYTMMDNRLEVKREEILVNDIPKPPFMLEKDPLEFSLEEYLQSLQYAEAVEALEIARVELIKELEEELGRLYRANAMDINTIDLRVTELCLMKFQFHQNFKMEETRILRAIKQLRMMDELNREERRIARIVHQLKSSMKSSQHSASNMENKKIMCEESIAKFAEQEKDLERNFRKDLGDVGSHFEFFFKTYKKKPKVSMKGLSKAEVYETMVRALRADNIRMFARENGEMGRVVVMAVYDMEDPMLMPKDCPRSYWDKFNKIRRERLICEYQTKASMAEIDRLNQAINEHNQKEAEGSATLAAVLAVVSHKTDLKSFFIANVEFQMILGKGQCEIDCWNFKEHVNANIILINNVERLNQGIYEASDKLIKEMGKTASVHRDIREIEWRFLVVEMATKDLKKVKHDVTCFKPTKKLLEVLRRGINLDTMHTDRIVLVDYLRSTYVKFQKIFLRTKRKLLWFYQHQTKRRHDGNDLYRGNIFDQTEVLVTTQASKFSPEMCTQNKEAAEKRTVQLMLRGYLNRKIIRLCNEVERLEEEMEKQYQRTYPVL